MYMYKIHKIKKIYDGDTMTVILDLGFGVYKTEIIRFSFINAPEVRGEERSEGLISRDWVRKRLYGVVNDGKDIYIKTTKDRKGKYGRYLGEIFIDGVSLNLQLVEEGFAELYKY